MGRHTVVNKITSPEKTALINPFNMSLRNDFASYLRATKKSEGTIAGYSSDLLIIFTYILDNLGNKKFTELTKRDVIAIQNWMIEANQNSPARVRRLKASMSSLSNYCSDVIGDEDPEFAQFRPIIRKVEDPALQSVREKTVLTDTQVDLLLATLVERGKYEHACLLALALFSGRRKSELARFRVDDFDDDKLVCEGALYKSRKIQTKGRSGGKYINCYTLAKPFKPYLDLWMQYRNEHNIHSEWLFPNHSDMNKQISIGTMDSWAIMFGRILGMDFYWHACRHRFTTYLVRKGIPDSVIQGVVAWESGDMVRVYTDIDIDEQISMYFKDGDIIQQSRTGFGDL